MNARTQTQSGYFLIAALLFSAGCTTTNLNMFAVEKRDPPVELGLVATDADLAVQLHTVIYYEGPGSWKSNANWDEYVLSVKNVSLFPVVLTAISLIDPLGETIESGIDPWALIKQTAALERIYRQAGIPYSRSVDPSFLMVAAAVGVEVGITMGAVVATEALWAAAIGGSALAATAVIALPVVAVVAIPVILISDGNKKRAIETEFGQRLFPLPHTIQPDETLSGSVFFPIVPSPGAILVNHVPSGASLTTQPSDLLLGAGRFDQLHVKSDQ